MPSRPWSTFIGWQLAWVQPEVTIGLAQHRGDVAGVVGAYARLSKA